MRIEAGDALGKSWGSFRHSVSNIISTLERSVGLWPSSFFGVTVAFEEASKAESNLSMLTFQVQMSTSGTHQREQTKNNQTRFLRSGGGSSSLN